MLRLNPRYFSIQRIPEISLLLPGALRGAWRARGTRLRWRADDPARNDEYVQVSSRLLLLYGLGAVAKPLAALVMRAFGPDELCMISGAVYVVLFGDAGIRALKRLPVRTEQWCDPADTLTSTQTGSTVWKTDNEIEDVPEPA